MNDKSYIINTAVMGNDFLTKGVMHQIFSPRVLLLPPREGVVEVRFGSLLPLEVELYTYHRPEPSHFVGRPQGVF